MDSRFSIPTDNIYKFYALFGLAFCIGALTLFVFTYNSHFETANSLFLELTKIDTIESPSAFEAKQKEILEKQITTISENKAFYMKVINAFLVVGIFIMTVGFYRWHYKVQPQIDKINALKIRQLEAELAKKTHVPFRQRVSKS